MHFSLRVSLIVIDSHVPIVLYVCFSTLIPEIQISTAIDPTYIMHKLFDADQVIIGGKLLHLLGLMGVTVVLIV